MPRAVGYAAGGGASATSRGGNDEDGGDDDDKEDETYQVFANGFVISLAIAGGLVALSRLGAGDLVYQYYNNETLVSALEIMVLSLPFMVVTIVGLHRGFKGTELRQSLACLGPVASRLAAVLAAVLVVAVVLEDLVEVVAFTVVEVEQEV